MKAIGVVLLLISTLLAGCVSKSPEEKAIEAAEKAKTDEGPAEPAPVEEEESAVEKLHKAIAEIAARNDESVEQIEVQHLLVGFEGTIPGKGITRSRDEAEKLTAELLEKINAGEDFDGLVKAHTDDSHPGIYGMVLSGSGDQSKGIYQRKGMVPAFGNVGWKLKVGEVGVAPHDAATSPYGWHIIKRLK